MLSLEFFTQLGWKAEVSKLIKYSKRFCVWFILTSQMIQHLGLVLVLFKPVYCVLA